MARKRTDDLERAIEAALAPGVFIGYRDNSEFVDGVEAVRAKLAPLIKNGEASRAVVLLETFIAGCYMKSEEIDDSLGSFGQFVEQLFCDWIRARQAAKAGPDETALMLLSWMDNDDYGYCHGLETTAVKVLNRAGLAAFERAVSERAGSGEKSSYARRRSTSILKAIYRKRRDISAFAALCEAEDGLAPADCESLAGMCIERRRPEDALTWVERGLDLNAKGEWPGRSAWGLSDLRRQILMKLGRRRDALASAWEDYQRAPSVHSYEDLLKLVPKDERPAWHAKTLAAVDGGDLASRVELLVKTRERDRLAATIAEASREELAGLSHYTTEPAAKCLERSHPLFAAKAHVAMALRILEAKKSRYYDAALGNLEKARKLMLKEGRDGEWHALTREIREAHRRKSGFMPGFERLVTGGSTKEASFLERARKRWDRGAGRRQGR